MTLEEIRRFKYKKKNNNNDKPYSLHENFPNISLQ